MTNEELWNAALEPKFKAWRAAVKRRKEWQDEYGQNQLMGAFEISQTMLAFDIVVQMKSDEIAAMTWRRDRGMDYLIWKLGHG